MNEINEKNTKNSQKFDLFRCELLPALCRENALRGKVVLGLQIVAVVGFINFLHLLPELVKGFEPAIGIFQQRSHLVAFVEDFETS